MRRERERRKEGGKEGSLSYAGAASTGVGDSQRYSRKSNEREPNEAILKGDIVGSLGRRTNSITSSGIEGGGGRREGVEHNERKRGRGRERAKRGMHSVQSAERGGVQTLCCRNGSVEILLGRLFYGSLDYDFTGLRFQYRRAPRRSSAQARVPDNRLSPRGDQFSGFSMFRYVVGRRGRGRAGLGRVEIRGCEN